tara:strand:+ start:685 stop:900 length:216 start_codon:yes stop_codon:yes gene_type:complete
MKPKNLKSKQVIIASWEVMCTCGGNCYESIHGSSWTSVAEVGKPVFECEYCDQAWTLPDNVDLVTIFKKGR